MDEQQQNRFRDDESKRKYYKTIPFVDIEPLKFETYLNENTSNLAIAVSGLLIVAYAVMILTNLDPWANIRWNLKQLDFYEYAFYSLIIVTACIAYKQLGYYYKTEKRGKNGIFKGIVKQVNPREVDLDFVLAVIGGLLFAFSILPVFWFLALMVYSIAVALRCYFTLKRKHYANNLREKRIDVPDWYTKALDGTWNGFVVKEVLGGWIVSHLIIGIYSLFSFILFYSNFDSIIPEKRMWFLLISLVGVFVLYFGLSKISYQLGSNICKWTGV